MPNVSNVSLIPTCVCNASKDLPYFSIKKYAKNRIAIIRAIVKMMAPCVTLEPYVIGVGSPKLPI